MANDAAALERFRREAQSGLRAKPPEHCTIYDIGELHLRLRRETEFRNSLRWSFWTAGRWSITFPATATAERDVGFGHRDG